MASLRRRPKTKFWFACFTDARGKRVQRSTRTTDRKSAQRLADEYEAVARGRATARQAQRVIADIFRRYTGSNLPSGTIRDYFNSWLARTKPEVKHSTYVFYESKVKRFLDWLGPKAVDELSRIDSHEILQFRAAEAARVAPTTVNHSIKFLRMVFEQAKRDAMIADNPAESVKIVKQRDQKKRRAFTIPEIRRVLEVADRSEERR